MSKEDVLLFGAYGMRGSGKSYYEKLKEKDKEIERLKNDLIEIKSYLTISKARLRLSSQYVTLFRDRYDKVMKILDRMEELKGDDRE